MGLCSRRPVLTTDRNPTVDRKTLQILVTWGRGEPSASFSFLGLLFSSIKPSITHISCPLPSRNLCSSWSPTVLCTMPSQQVRWVPLLSAYKGLVPQWHIFKPFATLPHSPHPAKMQSSRLVKRAEQASQRMSSLLSLGS
jgi:hypothetical protein